MNSMKQDVASMTNRRKSTLSRGINSVTITPPSSRRIPWHPAPVNIEWDEAGAGGDPT